MRKVIHINQHVIKKNKKEGKTYPPITIKTYKNNYYTDKVVIHGPSTVVYSSDCPLKCGAHCWIETEETVSFMQQKEEVFIE